MTQPCRTEPLPDESATRDSNASGIVAIWLVTAYLLLLLAGFVFMRRGPVMVGGNEMSVPRALFTAVNAGTLTGFQQSVALDEFQPAGQIACFALTVLATFLTMSASSLAVVRIARLPYSCGQVVTSALIAQVALTLAGSLLMMEHGRSVSAAVFQAVSALGNSGVTIGPVGPLNDARSLLVLLPLSLIGGLGLPVLMDIFDAIRRRRALSPHSRTVLLMCGAVFVIAAPALALFLWPGKDATTAVVRGALATTLGASINSRSAGLAFAQDYIYSYPRAAQWIVMLLMLIGAAPAGTGGGLKVTTIAALFRGAFRVLGGRPPGRALGFALIWLGLYLTGAFSALLWMLSSAPELSGDRTLFAIVSATGNVGLSHDPISVTAGNAYALSAAMLFGRFAPLAVLWWMAAMTRTTDAPEVAIG